MLEKPDIEDTTILACLRDDYGLAIDKIEFLPLGADRNTAVYRALTESNISYFVKLRSGDFNEMTVIVPKLLHDQGIQRVIAPLEIPLQDLWANLGDFKLVVFPYIDGRDGYQMNLSDQHWIAFGQSLKAIHTAEIPSTLTNQIQRETYSDEWRVKVKQFQELIEEQSFDDPISSDLAEFLRQKKSVITRLVAGAERLASVLQAQSTDFVLCHADLHAGNILIDANDTLYIVDWDTMILAPKERDLMYAGGGQFVNKRTPEQEESLFYQGYGQTQADPNALAYYRYERIVQDIAVYCEEVLLSEGDSEDRQAGARQLMSQFQPNQVIDITFKADTTLL